jgi:hypothetical protein
MELFRSTQDNLKGGVMGIWSGLRKTAPAAPVDESFQSRVNQEAEELRPLSTTEKARLYCKHRDLKDKLEEEIKKLNVCIEALSQLMIKELEADGLEQVRLDTGDLITIKDEPYVSVEERPTFIAWIRQTGQEDLLTVHYQTMSSMTKKMLQNGENPPPGLRVFLKQSITRHRPRS